MPSSLTEKLVDKIKSFCAIAGAFIEGLLISGTAKLNTVSKDYRYVACQLSREKKILKEKVFETSLFLKIVTKIPYLNDYLSFHLVSNAKI